MSKLPTKKHQDKVFVVTGGGSGLGRAYAHRLAAEGARVAIAEIDVRTGVTVKEEIREAGGDALFIETDVSSKDATSQMTAGVLDKWGQIDGLVANAALANSVGGAAYDEIEIDEWDRIMQVNVRGTWLVTRAAAPALRRAKRGKVVNIASDTALWGAPKLLHYVASKGAVIAMTRSLARELGPDGVAVNAVAPGLTLVGATEYVPLERHQLYVDNRAMKRRQTPEDVIGTVVFLLSDGADFVTGQLLPVNGGFVMN